MKAILFPNLSKSRRNWFNYLSLIALVLLFQSCMYYSRMTSPKVLESKERSWTLGAVYAPSEGIEEYSVQPIIGYRAGLDNKREFGATMYGVVYPGFVVNLKKNYYQNGDRYLTGDVSTFIGVARPTGIQYDVLYGSADLYGSVGVGTGVWFALSKATQVWGNASLGYEFGAKNRLGIQASYTFGRLGEIEGNIISIGMKMDLIGVKKNYRK